MSATAALVDPLASAYPILDPAGLHDLVGSEVVASGLRHKPGVSTTATLTTSAGRPWGWAQVLQGDQPDKIDNARRRAEAHGHTVSVRSLSGAGWFLCGRVGGDPRLQRGLAELADAIPDVDAALEAGTVQPLRYNALRRLVLRGSDRSVLLPADQVIRVTAARRTPSLTALERLAELGVPVLTPLREAAIPLSRRVTVWPWVDGSDLATTPDPRAARVAGAALGGLHRVSGSQVGHRIMRRMLPGAGPRLTLRRVTEAAGAVAPSLAPRLDEVLRRLPQRSWRPDRIVHGDFSADQVIAASDGIRIVDLDRLQLGETHHDLGGFAAAELRRTGGWGLTAELLAGYTGQVDPDGLTAWTAHALLLRLAEPFRAASPTWPEDMHHRLDEVERVLHEGVSF